jgi:hypothetical protein
MSTETIIPGDLLIGDFPVATVPVTIAAGADLVRGAVLGLITASSKYSLSASAAGDGSETPKLVLAVDAAAAGGDVDAVAYASAQLNADKLVLGTGHTAATAEAAFRAAAAPLYIKTLA